MSEIFGEIFCAPDERSAAATALAPTKPHNWQLRRHGRAVGRRPRRSANRARSISRTCVSRSRCRSIAAALSESAHRMCTERLKRTIYDAMDMQCMQCSSGYLVVRVMAHREILARDTSKRHPRRDRCERPRRQALAARGGPTNQPGRKNQPFFPESRRRRPTPKKSGGPTETT